MPISLRHAFQSAKSNGLDATRVQPTNWNAEHTLTCAADRVLGRATAGTGNAEELTCTATGRSIIAAANQTDARSAIGAGAASDVSALLARSIATGNGLTGGGNLSADRTLSVTFASQAQWRTAIQFFPLDAKTVWDAMAEVTLTDAANIVWDMSTGFDFIVTLGGNRTLNNPTLTKVGQKGRLIVAQDTGGGRTLTWSSNFEFANSTAPVLSSAANALDVFYYDVRSATSILVSPAGRAFG